MDNLYARTVFFISDVERSRRFYTEQLGCSVDWDSNDGVFQVGLFGLELILNDTGDSTRARVGHGRAFIGLEEDQAEVLRKHFAEHGVRGSRVEWGRPTLLIVDPDGNELLFWFPKDEFADLLR